MPKRLLDRCQPDSIREFRAAALRRFDDALSLAASRRRTGAMLPYQIIAAWRATDPVTAEQCRQAMIEEGASTLSGEHKPQLRFSSEEDAEAAKQRLIQRLSGSEQVWLISQDADRVEDWARVSMAEL